MFKWHRGQAVGRHPEKPPVKLSSRVSKAKVNKGVLVDEDDAAYLDKLAGRVGASRVMAVIMIILQWFEIEAFPRSE